MAEILIERGLPFVFATGYDQRGVPEAYRAHPTLQKPFQVEALERALQAVAAEAGQRLTLFDCMLREGGASSNRHLAKYDHPLHDGRT